MKIQYIAPSPKAGQTEHVSQQVGATLISAGFAKPCPVPPRGSPEWLAYMAERSRLAVPNPADVNPQVAVGVEWSVREKSPTSLLSRNLIVKRVGAETTFYDAPPADAPLTVVQRWRELLRLDAAAGDEMETLKAAKEAAEARKSVEKVLTAGVIYK